MSSLDEELDYYENLKIEPIKLKKHYTALARTKARLQKHNKPISKREYQYLTQDIPDKTAELQAKLQLEIDEINALMVDLEAKEKICREINEARFEEIAIQIVEVKKNICKM